MNKIILNNAEFEVVSYNRNTYLSDGTIRSNASANIKADIAEVNALLNTTITSLEITHDGTSIYHLTNLNAKMESMNEYLNGDTIDISINLTFDN